ncbi:hypothetical protein ACFLR1_07325 [Bacteroidota bacterium]
MKRTIRNEGIELSVLEHGVIYVRVFPGFKLELDKAEEFCGMISYLTSDELHVTVIDISEIIDFKIEALKLIVDFSREWGKTLALVLIAPEVKSSKHSEMINALSQVKYAVQVVSDSTSAFDWAREEYNKQRIKEAS